MAELPIVKDSNGVGKFNLVSLNQQMEAKIDSLPKDSKGAIIGIYDSKTGEAHAAVVLKKEIGPGTLAWSLEASKKFQGEPKNIDWETQIQYSWK